jgi:hypothetical protein
LLLTAHAQNGNRVEIVAARIKQRRSYRLAAGRLMEQRSHADTLTVTLKTTRAHCFPSACILCKCMSHARAIHHTRALGPRALALFSCARTRTRSPFRANMSDRFHAFALILRRRGRYIGAQCTRKKGADKRRAWLIAIGNVTSVVPPLYLAGKNVSRLFA